MQALLRAQGRHPVTSLGPSSLSLVRAYHVLGPVSAHLSLPTLEWHPSCGICTWSHGKKQALAPAWVPLPLLEVPTGPAPTPAPPLPLLSGARNLPRTWGTWGCRLLWLLPQGPSSWPYHPCSQ